MSDLTQVPPFFGTVKIEDGMVVELTGMANRFWLEQNPGHVGYDPDDLTNLPTVGLGYTDGVFEQRLAAVEEPAP